MSNLKKLDKYISPKIINYKTRKIPRTIIQTNETNLLPDKMINTVYTWINLNPEYSYKFFDNNDRINFIKNNFPTEVINIYHQLPHGAIKADLFRICYIYINGGVYSDIDQPCIKPLDSIIDDDDDFVSGVENSTPHQMLIISSPKNPFLKHLIYKGIERFKTKNPLKGPWSGINAGYFGPPAYGYSFIWFTSNNEPIIDDNGKWIFNYKIKYGKYMINNLNLNIKNFSLFKDTPNGNINSIACLKYPGYNNDIKLLNQKKWNHNNINDIKLLNQEKYKNNNNNNMYNNNKMENTFNEMENTFNEIYKTKQWGQLLSGPGSTLKSAANIIPYIINIIKTKNIKKIVDGSCGDCNWIMEVLKHFPNIEYIGNDVSSYIIEQNNKKFKNNENYKFFTKNIINEEIEKCDLFIFRHTMMHLKMSDNIKILDNIKKRCKYVLLTHHAGLTENKLDSDRISFYNKNEGFKWCRMSLNHKPFNLNPNKYLISTQKESSNNINELLCLYLINRKDTVYNFNEFLQLPILYNLNNIIKNSNSKYNEKLEGNILYEHLSNFTVITPNYIKKPNFDIKRQNLYNLAKNSKNLLEIGFNAGHSSVLFFYSNPNLKLLSFDIAAHKYTEPCVNFLKKIYDIEFVKGDSTKTVKNYIVNDKYDVIHIDGSHGIKCAEEDLKNCIKFAHKNTILVFDDTNQQLLNNLLNKYIEPPYNLIKEIDYNNIYKKCHYHRIFNYII